MKRFRIPGIVDLVLSEDAAEIETLAQNPVLDRAYTGRSLLLNGLVLKQVRKVLEVDGKPFPTVAARDAPGRAAAQTALWTRLQPVAERFRDGPEELENLATFVRGDVPPETCGLLVQEIVGGMFSPTFKATPASWDAALLLDKAPRTFNPALLAWWAATGRIARARQLLSDMVGGDPAGVHAVGIALHNIVSGVTLMRQLFSNQPEGNALSPKAAGGQCLFAPGSVLRQPTSPVSSAKGDLSTDTLVLLKLQAANAHSPGTDVVFLRETWSRCPAEQWVPALLEGIWRRACRLPPTSSAISDSAGCPFTPSSI